MTDAQIKENRRRILAALEWADEGLQEFLIKSDFFTAPASAHEYHLSEPGGLAQHSINVHDILARKAEGRYVKRTVVICGLMHDICKADFYKIDYRNKKINGRWESVPYYAYEDKFPAGHGEKSAILLMQLGVGLTTDEILAIRWHMGPWDAASYSQQQAFGAAARMCPLVVMLHTADMEATYLQESEKSEPKELEPTDLPL